MARNSRGNLSKKRKYGKNKNNEAFYKRMHTLKKNLGRFISAYKQMHRPSYINEYLYMDKLRKEIKRLFDIQGSVLWQYGFKEQRQYYQLLDKFKYYYARWKHWTYYTYLHVRFGVPFHLMARLKYYKRTKQLVIGGIFL